MNERLLTPISTAELERRWAAVRGEMGARGLDALVMLNSNDWLGGYVKWFTDLPAVNGYPCTVIFYADDPMSVIDMGPHGGRRDLKGGDKVYRGVGELLSTPAFPSVAYTDEYQAEIAVEALEHRGCRSIGFVGKGAMPYRFVARIEHDLGGCAKFIDATEFIDRLKAIKSEEEIALIRRAAAMQDEVFARVLKQIRPGMRDTEVTARAQYEGRLLGSEQGLFLGSSAPLGERSDFIDRHEQGRTLKAGEHYSLLIENNCHDGSNTEIARTIVLGKASNEVIDGFETVKEAQAHTLRLLKPGASCAEIAQSHDDYMRSRNLP